jgi:hypothetical protein
MAATDRSFRCAAKFHERRRRKREPYKLRTSMRLRPRPRRPHSQVRQEERRAERDIPRDGSIWAAAHERSKRYCIRPVGVRQAADSGSHLRTPRARRQVRILLTRRIRDRRRSDRRCLERRGSNAPETGAPLPFAGTGRSSARKARSDAYVLFGAPFDPQIGFVAERARYTNLSPGPKSGCLRCPANAIFPRAASTRERPRPSLQG